MGASVFTRSFSVLSLCGLLLGMVFSHAIAADSHEKYGGVGLQVVPVSHGDLVVLSVVEDSPAEKSGMRPGDLIIAVDGFSLEGSTFTEVVRRHLWGPIGSRSLITYQRPGVQGTHQVEIERIPLPVSADQTLPEVKILMPPSNTEHKKSK